MQAICAATGISKKGLYKYDRIKIFIGEILYHKKSPSHAHDPLYEERLLEKAQQAVQELSQAGKPITHQAVSILIGIAAPTIVLYPRLEELVHVSNICLYYPKVRVILESAITAQRTASKSAQN